MIRCKTQQTDIKIWKIWNSLWVSYFSFEFNQADRFNFVSFTSQKKKYMPHMIAYKSTHTHTHHHFSLLDGITRFTGTSSISPVYFAWRLLQIYDILILHAWRCLTLHQIWFIQLEKYFKISTGQETVLQALLLLSKTLIILYLSPIFVDL